MAHSPDIEMSKHPNRLL